MSGERDLETLRREMAPRLRPETFVYCSFPDFRIPAGLEPICTFREAEGGDGNRREGTGRGVRGALCLRVASDHAHGAFLPRGRRLSGDAGRPAGRCRHPLQRRGGLPPRPSLRADESVRAGAAGADVDVGATHLRCEAGSLDATLLADPAPNVFRSPGRDPGRQLHRAGKRTRPHTAPKGGLRYRHEGQHLTLAQKARIRQTGCSVGCCAGVGCVQGLGGSGAAEQEGGPRGHDRSPRRTAPPVGMTSSLRQRRVTVGSLRRGTRVLEVNHRCVPSRRLVRHWRVRASPWVGCSSFGRGPAFAGVPHRTG